MPYLILGFYNEEFEQGALHPYCIKHKQWKTDLII